MRATTYAMTHPAAYRAAQAAAVRTRALHPRTIPFGPGKAWGETRDLPDIPKRTFRNWWKDTHS